MSCYSRCSWCGGPFNGGNYRRCTNVSFGGKFVHNPVPISNNETPNFSYSPSQPQTSSPIQFHCFGCGDPIEEGAANISTYTLEPLRCFKSLWYDDDDYDYEESTFPLNEIDSKIPPSKAITPVLPTIKDHEDSLIMGNEELSTIPKKESNEFIKSSGEDLVPIPSESEDTSGSDSERVLPSCDDFTPINVFEEKYVTFSNPLFNSNDDFTSSGDKSLSDEDVSEDNVKIYPNPLFEFNDEYISSDVNPLFDQVLEDIECKVSYDSNLDEPTLLVTPLSDSNEDECFTPGDDVELLLHRDLSTPKMSVVSILEGFTDEPPLEENDDLIDLESNKNEWNKILYDAPIDNLMSEEKYSLQEAILMRSMLFLIWMFVRILRTVTMTRREMYSILRVSIMRYDPYFPT
nr:hypothetical protein [Tanacetum cinerariifolium]